MNTKKHAHAELVRLGDLATTANDALRDLKLEDAGKLGQETLTLAERLVRRHILKPSSINKAVTSVYSCFALSGHYRALADHCERLNALSGYALYTHLTRAYQFLDDQANHERCFERQLQGADPWVAGLCRASLAADRDLPEATMDIVRASYQPEALLAYIERALRRDPGTVYGQLTHRHESAIFGLAYHGNITEAKEAQRLFWNALTVDDGKRFHLSERVKRLLATHDPDWSRFLGQPCAAGRECNALLLDMGFTGSTIDACAAPQQSRETRNSRHKVVFSNTGWCFIKYAEPLTVLREYFAHHAFEGRLDRGMPVAAPERSGMLGLKPHQPFAHLSYWAGVPVDEVLQAFTHQPQSLPERIRGFMRTILHGEHVDATAAELLLGTGVTALAHAHALLPERYAAPRPTPDGYLSYIAPRVESFFAGDRVAVMDALSVLVSRFARGVAVPCKDAHPGNMAVLPRLKDGGFYFQLKDMTNAPVIFDFENLRWNTPHDDLCRLLEYIPTLPLDRIQTFIGHYADEYNRAVAEAVKKDIPRMPIPDVGEFEFHGWAYRPYFYVLAATNAIYGTDPGRRRTWMQRGVTSCDTLLSAYAAAWSDADAQKLRGLRAAFQRA